MLPSCFTNSFVRVPLPSTSTSRTTPPRPPQRQTRLSSPMPPTPRTSRLDRSEHLSAVLSALTIGLWLAVQMIRFFEVVA